MGWLSLRAGSFLSWMVRTIADFNFSNFIEILILAILVYYVLLWVKQTRGWTLLKGIVVLAVFVGIVYLLEFNTLIYIVNHGINIAVIAAIVIFQPELRKALEQIGERNFASFLFAQGTKADEGRFSDRTANEIVRATYEMAKVRTGALIVLEQEVTLKEYERTGILLDSLVSSQLLINIFEHNTPLHDGAVLIRGDRITAATCYLPLSDNMSLSKELGTRHRAGVGISEATDSLTIIVSEETGSVSVAYKGELLRCVTEEQLRSQLTSLQNKSADTRNNNRLLAGLHKLQKGWNKNEQ